MAIWNGKEKKVVHSLKHLQLCSLNDESAIKKVIYTSFFSLLFYPTLPETCTTYSMWHESDSKQFYVISTNKDSKKNVHERILIALSTNAPHPISAKIKPIHV